MILKQILNRIKDIYSNITNINSNINTINSNITNLQEKNILKAVLITDNTQLTSTTDYQTLEIPISQDLKIGNRLSCSNNKVIIGTNVNHIKISGACIIQNSSQANLHGFVVRRNNTELVSDYKTLTSTSYNDFQIPTAIYEVETGDEISIGIYLNMQGNSTTIKKYARSTFLQVEVVD